MKAPAKLKSKTPQDEGPRTQHSLTTLMSRAAHALPPQRPRRSAYRPLLPLLLQMQDAGHTPSSMADFLIQQKQVSPAKRDTAYRSIRNLLARHTPV